MKITPIEIRQKTFERVFRGYDKDEVHAFLTSLSREWERLQDDNRECRAKLELTQQEVRKLKDIEDSLYKTLKTAEETGTHMVQQASRSAELQVREAQQRADMLLADAQHRAQLVVQEADKKARQALEDMLNELKSLERDFRTMESLRDNLLLELKGLANNTLDRVSRLDAKSIHVSFDGKIRDIKNLIEERTAFLLEEASRPPATDSQASATLLPPDAAPTDLPPASAALALQAPASEYLANGTASGVVATPMPSARILPSEEPLTVSVASLAAIPAEVIPNDNPVEASPPDAPDASAVGGPPELATALPPPVPIYSSPKRGSSFFDDLTED